MKEKLTQLCELYSHLHEASGLKELQKGYSAEGIGKLCAMKSVAGDINTPFVSDINSCIQTYVTRMYTGGHKNIVALHSLLQVSDEQFYINKTSPKSYASIDWLLSGLELLAPAQYREFPLITFHKPKMDCEVQHVDLEKAIDLWNDGQSKNPGKWLYLPRVRFTGLYVNDGKPFESSFGILKGYWQEDGDGYEEDNLFEVILSKKQITSGVELEYNWVSDNDV